MADNGSSGTKATAIVIVVILLIAALFGAYYLVGGSGVDVKQFTIPTPM